MTTVSTTPVQLNDGTAPIVHLGNTGQVPVTVSCGTQSPKVLSPGYQMDVRPAGAAVIAVTTVGSTTVTVDLTGQAPTPGGLLTAAEASGTYAPLASPHFTGSPLVNGAPIGSGGTTGIDGGTASSTYGGTTAIDGGTA